MRPAKKKKIIIPLALSLLVQAAGYAAPASEGIGHLKIKDLPPAVSSDEQAGASFDLNSLRLQSSVGHLTISDEVIDEITRNRMKKDSDEVLRLKKQLSEAVRAANDSDYEQSILILTHLRAEHPESRVILKWLGIYQNWAGNYEESEKLMEQFADSSPLSPQMTDFMAQYYITDNHRHLGQDNTADRAKLKELAEKEDPKLYVDDITSKNLAQILAGYQEFMSTTENGRKGFSPTDSRLLDDLWKLIPREKQSHLDNFYGYNLDELTPVYANFYRRKDILDEYNKRMQRREQHLVSAEIHKSERKASPEAVPASGSATALAASQEP